MDPDATSIDQRVGLVAETQEEHASWQRLLKRLEGTDVDELREILQGVSRMRQKLALVERERSLASNTLDRLQLGIIIAGASGKILLINDTARELLAARNGLSDVDGYIRADLPSENRMLIGLVDACLLYTSPSPRDATLSRMPSSA